MKSFDLSYKLVDLKFKSKTPDQIYFCLKYFRNIDIICSLSAQDGEIIATPPPPSFFKGKKI